MLAREKVHMYCLLLETHSDKAAVVSQVRSLPEAEQWTKLVQPGLVELFWGEGVTDMQINPIQSLGQSDPHLLLLGQVVQVLAGEGGRAEGGRVKLAQDQHLDLCGKVEQADPAHHAERRRKNLGLRAMARWYQESCFKLVCLLAGSRSMCTDEQLSPNIGFLKMGGLCNFYSEALTPSAHKDICGCWRATSCDNCCMSQLGELRSVALILYPYTRP